MTTWEKILEAAERLEGRGLRPWSLDQLVREVQERWPETGRGTISPTLQGMTHNAPGGPPSACCMPISRVARSAYVLDR